jgi:hypothetical protein
MFNFNTWRSLLHMEEENQCFLLSEYSHRYGAVEASRLKLLFVAEHLHIPVGICVTTVFFPTNPLKPRVIMCPSNL